jgi:hypothetical protein
LASEVKDFYQFLKLQKRPSIPWSRNSAARTAAAIREIRVAIIATIKEKMAASF